MTKTSDEAKQDYTTNLTLSEELDKMNVPYKYVGYKDKLPKKLYQNNLYIINLANSTEPGTHWTGFIIKRGTPYYFDSFGFKAPKIVEQRFVDNGYKSYYYNDYIIQNPNKGKCGSYVLEFGQNILKYKNSFKDFLNYFFNNQNGELSTFKYNEKQLSKLEQS